MRYIILLLFLLNCTNFSFSQSTADRKQNECLVQLEGDYVITQVIAQLQKQFPEANISLIKTIAPSWNMHHLWFDENLIRAEDMLDALYLTNGVSAAQLNHRMRERDTEPNDPDWWRQNDMTLIGAQKAWDISTGGLTPQGDTIVIAVLEKGALMSHPDLQANRWYNYAEIPDNNIDDDLNGYVDDFYGFDPRFGGSGPGNQGSHGTAVNGIIGAVGNNNEGVAGVNWTVKLMNISNTEFETEIISAYNYVHKARKDYNDSQGQKGAFVVATNASFGIDREFAEDHPLWCAVYDKLGQEGVLNVGATSNSGNSNIDLVGDMPTDCPSQYLITVTNVDPLDNKVSGAGYGPIGIDMGAPGQDSYTTYNTLSLTPTYNTFGGTSAAAPHATGVIGLLYSLNCETFASDALDDPDNCARRVRDVLLDHVSPNTSLQGLTSTGGRLDAHAASEAVIDLCGGSPLGPLSVLNVFPNPVRAQLTVEYQTPSYDVYEISIYNILGQLIEERTVQPQPFNLNQEVFDTQYLPTGAYVVFISRNKVVQAKKFLKI